MSWITALRKETTVVPAKRSVVSAEPMKQELKVKEAVVSAPKPVEIYPSIDEIVAKAVSKALEARFPDGGGQDTPKPTKARSVARKGNSEALAKWRANKQKAELVALRKELAELKKGKISYHLQHVK